LNLHLRTV